MSFVLLFTGSVSKALHLLELGADPNVRDRYEFTALMWAADRGLTECVKALIKFGAHLSTQVASVLTMVGPMVGNTKCVHLLICTAAPCQP